MKYMEVCLAPCLTPNRDTIITSGQHHIVEQLLSAALRQHYFGRRQRQLLQPFQDPERLLLCITTHTWLATAQSCPATAEHGGFTAAFVSARDGWIGGSHRSQLFEDRALLQQRPVELNHEQQREGLRQIAEVARVLVLQDASNMRHTPCQCPAKMVPYNDGRSHAPIAMRGRGTYRTRQRATRSKQSRLLSR